MKNKQLLLEQMYNKYQQIPMLTKIFKEMEIIDPEDDMEKPLITLLVHMVIQKRMPIGTAVGILAAQFDMETSVNVIELAVAEGAVKQIKKELVVQIEPDKEILDLMDSYMFPPPMVVRPNPIKSNNDSGYLTIKKSVMSKRSHTKEDVCLDVLNILNGFEFTIDLEVLNTSNQYKSLATKKPQETQKEYSKRFNQWKRFDLVTRDLIDTHYKDVKTIWFTHQYDKRGRIYCRGYNFNYQGAEWNKALIQMKKEIVNEA